MRQTPQSRALLAGIMTLTALVGLAGCTGKSNNQSENQGDGQNAASASPTPAPTLPSGVSAAPVPTKVPNEPSDRQNVVMSGCDKADGGGWQATGTATNTGKKSVTYQITVFFTTSSATTLNSASTKVDVQAGKTEKWTADKKFTTPPQVLCVLRGVAKV